MYPQDPSIWTNPSAEQLKTVGGLDPIPNQPLGPQAAARGGEAMGRAASVWEGGGGGGGGGSGEAGRRGQHD